MNSILWTADKIELRSIAKAVVSIIVPVYDVEQYIDQCIESVCSQTYRDLEIIIVYDESTDNSYAHCLEWEQKDKRIKLIVNQNRKGLGAARNEGIMRATGEYILFVDSDDWIDVRYVEVLYNAIIDSGADFVSGSTYYEVRESNTVILHGMPEGQYQTEEMKAVLLCGDFVTAWKKLYRRDWLLKNQLMQPEFFHYEDWGAYPTMVSSAKKIYVSAIPGMYYRVQREGCLSLDSETRLLQDFERNIEFMFRYLKRQGKWKAAKSPLAYYCWRDFYVRNAINLISGNNTAKSILKHIKTDILIPEFGLFNPEILNYIVSGSFSLRWEVQRGCIEDARVDRHFCFSSLISVFSDELQYNIVHENLFRQKQVQQEAASTLIHEIANADDKTIFFIDFLEERFDVLEIKPGIFVTASDAYQNSNLRELTPVQRIKSGSDVHMILWKNACDQLVTVLKRHINPHHIVLVRNRMACSYGNFVRQSFYENEHEIREINQMIEHMESYFISQIPNITVVEQNEMYTFTDSGFRLGCYPEYLNNAWYTKVGLEIFDKILQENK